MNESRVTLTALQENQYRSVAFSESCDMKKSKGSLKLLSNCQQCLPGQAGHTLLHNQCNTSQR